MSRYHLRALIGMGLWLVAVLWAVFLPGGSHDSTQRLLTEVFEGFRDPLSGNAYLLVHFSLMGIWPWVLLLFWAGETPFRGNLWSKLVVFALSNMLGAFVALPYEALRSAEPKRLPPRWFFRMGNSRWLALALLILSGTLFLFAVVRGGFWDYMGLLQESSFVRVMAVDFLLFQAVAYRLILRDAYDRKTTYHPAQYLFFALPLFGPLVYLLFRKQLEAAHPAMVRF